MRYALHVLRYVYVSIIGLALFCIGPYIVSAQTTFSEFRDAATTTENGQKNPFIDIGIDRDAQIKDNVKTISRRFYQILQILGTALVFIYIALIGFKLLLFPTDESERQKAAPSFLYLLYGVTLYFAANFIIGKLINPSQSTINPNDGINGELSTDLNIEQLSQTITSDILLQTITLFKYLLFFVAILMVIYYGYRMIAAFDKEDKIKAARTGIANVVITLLFVRVITFVYDLAAQGGSAIQVKGSALLVRTAQFLGMLLGAAMVGVLIYSGFRLITSRGDESVLKSAGIMIRNIFIIGLVVVLFLLIMYTGFSEFNFFN